MLSDAELIELQARALFTHDENSRIVLINEPGGQTPAPRMFLGRTTTGNIWRFRHDLPTELTNKLAAICREEPVAESLENAPRNEEQFVKLLEQHGPVTAIERGPALCFTDEPEAARPVAALTVRDAGLLSGGFEDCLAELPEWQPFVAVIENGRAVSICRSVRITNAAHEAGVHTLASHRGHGFAIDATAEWARLVRSTGAIPLYSTSWDNLASKSVARKLNLRLYGADFHIT